MFNIADARREHFARRQAESLKKSMQPLAFIADSNELRIDGEIGTEPDQISARQVKAVLAMADRSRPLVVKIHSPGGAIFEGLAIHDAIKAYDGPKRCVVENCAFSAASVVVCAFAKGEVSIQPNGYFLLHGTHSENDDMTPEEQALLKDLDRRMTAIYCDRTGKSQTTIAVMLTKESYLHADDALAFGLVDSIIRPSVVKPMKVAAKYKLVPANNVITATSQWRSAVDAMAKTMSRSKAILQVDRDHPGLRQKMIEESNKR